MECRRKRRGRREEKIREKRKRRAGGRGAREERERKSGRDRQKGRRTALNVPLRLSPSPPACLASRQPVKNPPFLSPRHMIRDSLCLSVCLQVTLLLLNSAICTLRPTYTDCLSNRPIPPSPSGLLTSGFRWSIGSWPRDCPALLR